MRNKNTLFVGKVLLHFSSLDSTNQYALELLAKSAPIEGTVISTFHQYAGRGQIGSTWESEPDRNIAASVILYPTFLPAAGQFLLSQAVALAVADCLDAHTPEPVAIKWPNDIYAGGAKIAGILIQNALGGQQFVSSVAGIGINVNQTDFSPDLPNPVSLRLLTGLTYDLHELLGELCRCLERRYLQLKEGRRERLRADYLARLYRRGETMAFRRPGGATFSGRISGVDERGRLLVEKDDGHTEAFDLKAVIYR